MPFPIFPSSHAWPPQSRRCRGGSVSLFSVTGPRHLLETSCSPPGRRFPFPAQNLPPASVPLPGACGAAAAAGRHPVRNVPVGMHSIRPDLLFSPLIFLRLTLVFASRWQEALWCCSRAVLGLCGEPSPRELHFPAHALSVQTQAARKEKARNKYRASKHKKRGTGVSSLKVEPCVPVPSHQCTWKAPVAAGAARPGRFGASRGRPRYSILGCCPPLPWLFGAGAACGEREWPAAVLDAETTATAPKPGPGAAKARPAPGTPSPPQHSRA